MENEEVRKESNTKWSLIYNTGQAGTKLRSDKPCGRNQNELLNLMDLLCLNYRLADLGSVEGHGIFNDLCTQLNQSLSLCPCGEL